jgi:DNA-3-methyladenine glycosylase
MNRILNKKFFQQTALVIAPILVGKVLVRKLDTGEIVRLRITETEIYYGWEDAACHSRFGKTNRNAVMFEEGGYAYIYLCYGLHHLLTVITGPKDHPEGVMIRAAENLKGPGLVTRKMQITMQLNWHDMTRKDKLWIEDDGFVCDHITKPRVGINYATEPYKSIPWRFVMVPPTGAASLAAPGTPHRPAGYRAPP